MSDSSFKNHWQELVEQLGVAVPETKPPEPSGEGDSSPSAPMETMAEGPAATDQPRAEEATSAAVAESMSAPIGTPDLPSAGSSAGSESAAGKPTSAVDSGGPVGAGLAGGGVRAAGPRRALGMAKKLSPPETHAHWSNLAQRLGLPVSIDIPVAKPPPAPAVPAPAATEPPADLLAYEVPPAQPSAPPIGDWREHQGEFDAVPEPDVAATELESAAGVADRQPIAEEHAIAGPPPQTAEERQTPAPLPDEEPAELARTRPRRRCRGRGGDRSHRRWVERSGRWETPQSADEEEERTEEATAGEFVGDADVAPEDVERTTHGETESAADEPHRKHGKIPTWEQAVGYIIDHNLAQRSRGGSDSRRGWSPRH